MEKKRTHESLLRGVTAYLHWRAQSEDVRSQSEYEDLTLALHIIGQVRQNDPQPVENAYVWAFGIHKERFLQGRRDREWMAARALYETVDQTSSLRRPTEERGAVYQMPSRSVESVKEPMLPVPRKAAAAE